MLSRGTMTIFAILALGVVLALVSVWYQAQMGRRCLEVWGVEGANLIRHAPRVVAMRIATPDSFESEARLTSNISGVRVFTLDDHKVPVEIDTSVDMSLARGLVHARHALIVDHNYEAADDSPASTRHWQYVLQFSDDDRDVSLFLAPDSRYVKIVPTGGEQRLRAETMLVVVAFIEREIASVGGDKRTEDNPVDTSAP